MPTSKMTFIGTCAAILKGHRMGLPVSGCSTAPHTVRAWQGDSASCLGKAKTAENKRNQPLITSRYSKQHTHCSCLMSTASPACACATSCLYWLTWCGVTSSVRQLWCTLIESGERGGTSLAATATATAIRHSQYSRQMGYLPWWATHMHHLRHSLPIIRSLLLLHGCRVRFTRVKCG